MENNKIISIKLYKFYDKKTILEFNDNNNIFYNNKN